jgi:hypothetical protein
VCFVFIINYQQSIVLVHMHLLNYMADCTEHVTGCIPELPIYANKNAIKHNATFLSILYPDA